MKVQVLFNSSYPIGKVSTHRVHHLCKGLVDNGVDVELSIVHPTENMDNIQNQKSSGVYEGVNYQYILKNTIRKKNVIFRKLIDYYSYTLVVFQILFNLKRKDIFIIIGPSFDFRILLPIAILFNKAKILLEINEYPFVTKSENIFIKFKRNILFQLIFPLYDGFIVISTELKILLKQYKSQKVRIIKIPILGDFSVQQENLTKPFSDPYIIHSGSLYEEKDGVVGILKAYKIALDKLERPIKFVITGNIANDPSNEKVNRFIIDNRLEESIIFTGFLSKDELGHYMEGASLAIINKYDNMQNRYCFSTKLADYLKFRVPVIATAVGELQIYLKDEENAYIVKPEDTKMLAGKIIEALSDLEKTSSFAVNGLKLIEKEFNYKYQGKILKDFLLAINDEE